MPRPPLVTSDFHPYHIRARSNNRDWYELPLCDCFQIYSDVLKTTIEKYEIRLHAFVLMSNHFHMVASTPKLNLSPSMRYFMTESARGIRDSAFRINHVYGGRYKPTLITNPVYYANCLKYIFRNPIRAGLATSVEDYPWSSMFESGQIRSLISPPPEMHLEFVPLDSWKLIEWLNQPTPKELETAIKRGLRHSEFGVCASGDRRKLPNLEEGLIRRYTEK
jgi:putative transposase